MCLVIIFNPPPLIGFKFKEKDEEFFTIHYRILRSRIVAFYLPLQGLSCAETQAQLGCMLIAEATPKQNLHVKSENCLEL